MYMYIYVYIYAFLNSPEITLVETGTVPELCDRLTAFTANAVLDLCTQALAPIFKPFCTQACTHKTVACANAFMMPLQKPYVSFQGH